MNSFIRKAFLIEGATVAIFSIALALAAMPRMSYAETVSHNGDGAMLIAAVRANRIGTVRKLAKNGADVDARVPGDGTALIVAARRGDLAAVNALLQLGANVNEPSRGDGNPLIMASMAGHLAVVKRLMNAGANVNAIVPGDETPLINAAREGHLAIVKYLIAHGAKVNLGVMTDHGWRSPLNQAHGAGVRNYLIDQGAVRGGP
jgi:ankyrin repeat protein